MKIRTERGHTIDIYGIYWVLSVDGTCTETIFLGFPRGNGGLTPYRITGKLAEKVDIVDSSIPDGWVYYYSGVYHRRLIEDSLLDDLLEYDETAYKRFLEILKSEGHVNDDFY